MRPGDDELRAAGIRPPTGRPVVRRAPAKPWRLWWIRPLLTWALPFVLLIAGSLGAGWVVRSAYPAPVDLDRDPIVQSMCAALLKQAVTLVDSVRVADAFSPCWHLIEERTEWSATQ